MALAAVEANSANLPKEDLLSYLEAILRVFCDNFRRYHAGAPLLYEVDFDKGY